MPLHTRYYLNKATERPRFFLGKLLQREVAKGIPYGLTSRKLAHAEARLTTQEQDRLDYYLQPPSTTQPVTFDQCVSTFKRDRNALQYFDVAPLLHRFAGHYRFNILYGDITAVPTQPAFVKSRPIHGDNANAVLLKISTLRHFSFVEDLLSWEQKQDSAIWRGHAHNDNRKRLITSNLHNPKINAAQTNRNYDGLPPKAPFMPIPQQLKHKFLLSIEGVDVASNLKWAMGSQSLVISPTLHYETWFMEGMLQPGVHYVEVKNDFSDLEAKIDYYLSHPAEAKAIVRNANNYTQPFRNHAREWILNMLVIKRYFETYN
ncbi:glycosyl transferase family 90 [Reinekea blandensis]|uniref:Putative lipopolysaccharide A protein n=1 Tax=Reinekea blandensis MED297 TaxID=314283 RepID=A4BIX1_9GAMM|nr:glycosyl transferase family 90 [Reinekea blandensis]EAR07904.1 putative lipopolysaccharide A protein [Reinekea sp. MED297] [Reinekea blandensis MED297]